MGRAGQAWRPGSEQERHLRIARAEAVPEPAPGLERRGPGSWGEAKRGSDQPPGPRTACSLSLWPRWRVRDGLFWTGQLTRVSETQDRPDGVPPPPTGPGRGQGWD